MIGLLLVDDEELVRAGLRVILSAEPDLEVRGEAADGSEVPGLVRRLEPDVVLMDVRMRDVDGITATRHLVTTMACPPRILVLTSFGNDATSTTPCRPGPPGSCSSGPDRRRSCRPCARWPRGSRCCSPRPSATWWPPAAGRP